MSVSITTKVGSAGAVKVTTVSDVDEGKSVAELQAEVAAIDFALARKNAPAQLTDRKVTLLSLIANAA